MSASFEEWRSRHPDQYAKFLADCGDDASVAAQRFYELADAAEREGKFQERARCIQIVELAEACGGLKKHSALVRRLVDDGVPIEGAYAEFKRVSGDARLHTTFLSFCLELPWSPL